MGTEEVGWPLYLHAIMDYVRKPERLVVGLIAGTSADGVSSVLARISGQGADTQAKVLACESFPYPEPLNRRIFDLFSRDTATIDRIAQADNEIGRAFADSARRIAEQAGFTTRDLDLVASCGQVTYQVIEGQRPEHRWLGERAVTGFMVLGAGAVIAEQTGVTTVTNIHQRDIAAGGIGVPGLTFADWALFRDASRGRIVNNIGGISNPTVIPAGARLEDVFSFDSGPGNMIIDGLMSQVSDGKLAFDEDGRFAAGGTVHRGLLAELMQHPFLRVPPPRGAARQLFGLEYTAGVRSRGHELGLSDQNIAATVTAFTAESMVMAYRDYVFPRARVDEVYLAGGGAHNKTLQRLLAQALDPVPVGRLDDIGYPVDSREALAVAVVGNETLLGGAANNPSATGAARRVIVGDITPAGANPAEMEQAGRRRRLFEGEGEGPSGLVEKLHFRTGARSGGGDRRPAHPCDEIVLGAFHMQADNRFQAVFVLHAQRDDDLLVLLGDLAHPQRAEAEAVAQGAQQAGVMIVDGERFRIVRVSVDQIVEARIEREDGILIAVGQDRRQFAVDHCDLFHRRVREVGQA